MIWSSAGTKIFIGTAITGDGGNTLNAASFANQTWTEIKEVENVGSFGDTAEEITFASMGDERMRKLKGTRNAGNMELVCGADYSDAGQLALIAAEKTDYNYAFKLTFDDKPVPDSRAATITIATPGVVTWADHPFVVGDKVKFSTTGALPTGLSVDTEYFVKTTPDEDTFTVSATANGGAIATTGSQSGTHTATSVPGGSDRLFHALVMGAAEQLDQANSVIKLNCTLAINSNIVRVPASTTKG